MSLLSNYQMVISFAEAKNIDKGMVENYKDDIDATLVYLKTGEDDKALKRWRGVVEGLYETYSTMDINALVQWVMRESYLENTESLKDYANKVQGYNELKKTLREEIANLKGFLIDSTYPMQVTTIGLIFPDDSGEGNFVVNEITVTFVSKEELEDYIKKLEIALETTQRALLKSDRRLGDVLVGHKDRVFEMYQLLAKFNEMQEKIFAGVIGSSKG